LILSFVTPYNVDKCSHWSRDYEEDDRKRRGRDRGYGGGPTTTFAEKKGYKPEVSQTNSNTTTFTGELSLVVVDRQ
jgi:hypothetical protein